MNTNTRTQHDVAHSLVGTGKRRNVFHLLVQRLVVYWSVVNANFVLAALQVVKVGNSVLHPVFIITLCEVLTRMSSAALLQHEVHVNRNPV